MTIRLADDDQTVGQPAASALVKAVREWRAFFAAVTSELSPPTIEFELRGYLHCVDTELPIRIANQATVAQTTLTAIVEGFQSAVDSGLRQLMEQLLDACPAS